MVVVKHGHHEIHPVTQTVTVTVIASGLMAAAATPMSYAGSYPSLFTYPCSDKAKLCPLQEGECHCLWGVEVLMSKVLNFLEPLYPPADQ